MPWTIDDVEGFVEGLSDKQKSVWVEVANKTLAACEAAGEEDCEASAIAQASSVAKTIKEAGGVSLGEKIIEALMEDDEGLSFTENFIETGELIEVVEDA